MSDRNTRELGRLLQEYARARWGSNHQSVGGGATEQSLDWTFRDRLEILGMDV
jgi:hypothetical protein